MPLPAAPGRRIAYDVDGTVMAQKADPGLLANMSGSDISTIKNEASDAISAQNSWGWGSTDAGWVIAVFPEPMDLDGTFISYDASNGGLGNLEGSDDTTDGIDGTWTEILADVVENLLSSDYRTDISEFTETGLTGLRWRITQNWPGERIRNWHIYGSPSTGADPDRLIILDPIDEPTVVHDWGDQGQGQLTKQQFAIKNTSATLTAEDITIAVEAFTGASAAWYEFSIDDSVYTASLGIGDLVAGANTTFWLRQDIPQGADLSQQAARIYAEASSWV